MNFRILCVGSIKEAYLREGIKEYIKRLSKYGKVTVTEVGECPIEEKSIDVEGESLLKQMAKDSFVVLLDREGRMLSSEGLADLMEEAFLYKTSEITFVIGGSQGLSSEVKQRGNYTLSFSKLTFPHQLMRLVLLEQIYRGVKIIKKEKYHK